MGVEAGGGGVAAAVPLLHATMHAGPEGGGWVGHVLHGGEVRRRGAGIVVVFTQLRQRHWPCPTGAGGGGAAATRVWGLTRVSSHALK